MFADVKILLSRPIVPKLISLILLVLLIGQIVVGIRSFVFLDKATSVRHDQIIDMKTTPSAPALNVGIKTAFFGDYVPQNISDADVRQSMLDLTIVGIMFANEEEASHVIIRTSGGQEKTFGIGDSLPGGAIIKRITSDGVLIRRNGALERLSLPKSELIFDSPAEPLGVTE